MSSLFSSEFIPSHVIYLFFPVSVFIHLYVISAFGCHKTKIYSKKVKYLKHRFLNNLSMYSVVNVIS